MKNDRLSKAIRRFNTPAGAVHVLETYLALHKGRIGMHWMYAAISRVVAGDTWLAVMADFGWQPVPPPECGKRFTHMTGDYPQRFRCRRRPHHDGEHSGKVEE